MLHYSTQHCPAHVTNLIASYENILQSADKPTPPVGRQLLAGRRGEKASSSTLHFPFLVIFFVRLC